MCLLVVQSGITNNPKSKSTQVKLAKLKLNKKRKQYPFTTLAVKLAMR